MEVLPDNIIESTILIVDDNQTNIAVLYDYLSQFDFLVLVAQNGESALEVVKEEKPDLILLDILMPGIDGFDVCKKLKELDEVKEIPVIFMSALSETVDKLRGFEVGAVDYITKPFQKEEVLARVTAHLTIRKQKVELQSEISERKKAQAELQQMNEHLEERVRERTRELNEAKERAEASDRLKSEFLAQMSHEIRTPINHILSFTSLIESELEDQDYDEDLIEHLRYIQKGSRRLVRTFDLIIEMAKLQSGAYDLNIEQVPLSEHFVKDAIAKQAERAKEKRILFKVDNPHENDTINADKKMLKVIIDNIIDNAITFTQKGKVSVTFVRNDCGNIVLSVEDTGIGISEEYMPQMFEPFSQEDQGYSRTFEGNGLGLTLVKKYCEFLKYDLNIESEKEKGTKVTVEFN